LPSESARELRGLITILGKRLDLVEEAIKKIDRLSNRIIDLEESVDEAKDNVEEIDEKVSGMITDRDHVITALARMVNNELGPGHSV
jgi:chromosome segregation ATPase